MIGLKSGMPLFVIVALSALLLLVSCGDGDGSAKNFGKSSDQSKPIPPDQLNAINVVLAGSDWYVGDNNFVFGITDAKDEPQGGAKATVSFYDLADSKNPKLMSSGEAVASAPGVGPVVEVKHADGEVHKHGGQDENRVGYYVKTKFDHAGVWGISVSATLKNGTKGTSNIAFEVSQKPKVPAVGQKAFPSDNLTRKDVANITEIDSGIPPNDMHDVKIKDAMAAGRPLVIVFSTPSFCTSRFCGPVTEEVESLQAIYRDRVDFVHIEIWRSFERKELNPTAKQWLQQPDGSLSEPIVYVVDKAGTIFDRWEGPVARNVMEPSVKAVAEGATRQ